MTFKKSEYDGLDTKRMEKDLKRMTKQYIGMGYGKKEAAEKAKEMIEYYSHQYRVFS